MKPDIAAIAERVDAAVRRFDAISEDKFLQKVQRQSKKLGVDLDVERLSEPPSWHVGWIKNEGKKGSGAKALEKLHQGADKRKKDVLLITSEPKLQQYYSKMGYENPPGSAKNVMIRKPR